MKASRIALLTVFALFVIVAPLWAGAPIRYGLFDQADFTPPDFADGGSATVTVGESKTFTFACHCADQPKTVPCNGSILLQVDSGSGYTMVRSAACSIPELQWCSVTDTNTFTSAGTFTFRIMCDEAAGTDYTQSAAEVVHVTVTAAGCTNGATRPCPLQEGVCVGSFETCTGGVWPGCSYGSDYGEPELTCDGLDNDCDGAVDNVDLDEDGYGICPGLPGAINELLLTGESTDRKIYVYEYRNGEYHEAWSILQAEAFTYRGGAEAGDLNGDGTLEFVVEAVTSGGGFLLQVWSYDEGSWSVLWSRSSPDEQAVDEIADVDGDGVNELLITDQNSGRLLLYSYDGAGFQVESTVYPCTEVQAIFHAAAADMDGDGAVEIAFQCYTPEPIRIFEYDNGAWPVVGSVPVPITVWNGLPMVVDFMEAGDVNHDGRPDVVFCGNSGQGHVLTFTGSGYVIEYSSPEPAGRFLSQACSVADMTNDGADDFVVVSDEGTKLFTYDEGYSEVWSVGVPMFSPSIGGSAAGDSDNDGFIEFITSKDPVDPDRKALYGNDGGATYAEEATFSQYGGAMIIANLNPDNDIAPTDCDDSDPVQGVWEVCGDGGDNDCDGDADEGCPTEFCGNAYCAGSNLGETCQSCPADCGCYGPSCRFGCCGDGTCGKNENTTNCPVDCH